jgi:hypothetical protein
VNKKHHIFNREVTPEQYKAFLEKFFSSTPHEQQKYLQKKDELFDALPKKY